MVALLFLVPTHSLSLLFSLCQYSRSYYTKMASIQCERKEELSYEEKERLDELIKQAESLNIREQALAIVTKNECLDKAAAANLWISAVAGGLANLTGKSLRILATKTWKGYTVKNYSNPLEKVGSFACAGLSGVKSAVVYSGTNHQGVDCAWLLAFSDTSGRRVYAEVGRKDKFKNMNWSKVEQNLNNAGMIVNAYDSETGTRLVATIVGATAGSAVAASLSG